MYPLLLSSVLIYCLLLYNVGVGSLALVLLLLLRFFDSCHHPTPTTYNSHCCRHHDDLRLASVKYGIFLATRIFRSTCNKTGLIACLPESKEWKMMYSDS
jgi:hypothetical protein